MLSQNYDYDIILNSFLAKQLKEKGVDVRHFSKIYPEQWTIGCLSKKMNKLLYHIVFRILLIKVLLYARIAARKYDIILLPRIDVYAFTLVSWLFGKNCYVIDHGIGNITNCKAYKYAWKLVPRRIHMIVLEDFIKEMVDNTLKGRSVSVLRHPLPTFTTFLSFNGKKNEEDKTIHLFGPSGSNDETFIRNLCKTVIPPNVRIVVKSHQIEYKSEQLHVYKGYLSESDYQRYMSKANYILLPYSPTYNYRISAVLFEAMVKGIPVMLLANNTLIYYKDIFKGNVCLFSSAEELIEKVTTFIPSYSERMLQPYSDEELTNKVLSILG